mgnify:CR=1 FL=1
MIKAMINFEKFERETSLFDVTDSINDRLTQKHVSHKRND